MKSDKKKKKEISREQVQEAMARYLQSGGKIIKLKTIPDDSSRKVYPEKNRSHYEFDSGLDEFNS